MEPRVITEWEERVLKRFSAENIKLMLISFLKILFYLIYLAGLGLSCGMQHLILRIGIKPRSPVLGGLEFSHWTTREVP